MLGARHIGKDTLIIIDPSGIQKLYARKMEHLAHVRDGDSGEIGNGYDICMGVACESGERKITPLSLKLWSAQADGFKSRNDEILGVIDQIRAHSKQRGIYVMDRGGDGDRLFDALRERGLDYIVRLVGNRKLCHGKTSALASKLAESCKMTHAETLTRETCDGKTTYELQYGAMGVALPQRPDVALRMVVVRGFGAQPMLLLTTLADTSSRKALWQVVEGYVSRWRVKETIRFVKQSYNLEDIRVLRYQRLKNMLALLLAVVCFNCSWLAGRLRCEILASNLTRSAKRIFGVSGFLYYALADGIGRIFSRHGRRKRKTRHDQDDPNPLGLVFLE